MAELFPFYFSQKSSLLLIFFANGTLLTFLLVWKGFRDQNESTKWLSFFLLLCVLYITPFMLGYAGWYASETTRNILFYIPFQQLLLIGPVIYIYTRRLLDEEFEVTGTQKLHFLPALLYNLAMLFVFINDQWTASELYFYEDGMDMDLDPWYQWLGLFSMGLYCILSILFYNRYEKAVFRTLSFAEELLYKWMRQFLIFFLCILVLRILFFILNPEWWEFGSKFWYYLSFSLLFNFIGLRGYIHSGQTELSRNLIQVQKHETAMLIHAALETQMDDTTTGGSQYDTEELESRQQQLTDYIKSEQAFQNPQLTLTNVADDLEITTKLVSTVVNSQFEMNFNDWVNKYRTEAVIGKMKEGAHIQQTLLSIALECGFNSKSTFNRAFKKHTGVTPARYLETLSE